MQNTTPIGWQHRPNWNGTFNLANTSFLVATPLLALILSPLYVYFLGFTWSLAGIFLAMSIATGISVTAGYHRLFSHPTYECHWIIKLFFLLFGAAAFENSAYKWSSDHRYHHRFVDKNGDPYNINKGFFFAHMGWIFLSDPVGRSFDNIKDLAEDRLVVWQHKYFLRIAIVMGFVLPTLVGALVGRPFGGFLFGGLLRMVILHHSTFLINSAAHYFGSRPYTEKNSARDCWWLAFFSNGEGFHNFHHAFANDYRNGVRWYHWDPSKWLIYSMGAVGLAKNLRRTPDWQIYQAKLDCSHEAVQTEISAARHEFADQYRAHLEALKLAIDEKIRALSEMRREYQEKKSARREAHARDKQVRQRYIRQRIHLQKIAIKNGWAEYRAMARFAKRFASI